MRCGNLLLLLVGYTTAVQFPSRRSSNETTTNVNSNPKRYIVELTSRTHCSHVAATIAGLPNLTLVKQFDWDIFPSVSIECNHECNAELLRTLLDESLGSHVVASLYKSSPVKLPPTIEGESFSNDAAAANYSVHGLTGVEKLHQSGILGKGATVAIVDSGIQYTHPALGGGFGPGFKVTGGYDLVGDNWPDAPANPDMDPIDRFGHGTHVAGIIAGQSDQFVGVAPSANLLSFKVFGKGGYSTEEAVIEGFLMAFESGADIISASVGEESGFTTNAWAVVASRMVEQGVVVVIAAGNAGQDGPFSASNGASGKNVLTIASAEPGVFPAQAFSGNFSLDGVSNKTPIAYIPGTGYFPSTIVEWPIKPVVLNSSVENDACIPLSNNTMNMTDTIVLVRDGGCSITTKHANLAAFGAKYILVYNNGGPYLEPFTSNPGGLIGAIEARSGEAIINAILAGGHVTASFDIDSAHYVGLYNAGGGRPARYSSWGSTYDLALKPDVAAPGTKILSTYPTNEYRVLSGTSMATPYIAGIAALWVSKYGGRAAHARDPAWSQRLTARIMSTARAMPWADYSTSSTDYGFWAPPTQVGAGFVDAERVLSYTTELGFDGRKFQLNDTANFIETHSVEITNGGREAVTYQFSLQDAGGYTAYAPIIPGQPTSFGDPSVKYYWEITPVKISPDVSMPHQEFTVKPSETKTAEFSFRVPSGLDANSLPVHGGKVLVSGSNGEELGIPYFGVACDLKKTIANIWDYGSNFPYMVSGVYDIKIENKSNFTFNLTLQEQDFPKMNSQLAWGTKELRWDIFNANYTEESWIYPPIIGKNGYVGSATSWNGTASTNWFTPGKDSEDDIFSFPLYNQPRGDRDIFFWLGRFADGSSILPGSYNFRIAALRPFGNPSISKDWDIWRLPEIKIL